MPKRKGSYRSLRLQQWQDRRNFLIDFSRQSSPEPGRLCKIYQKIPILHEFQSCSPFKTGAGQTFVVRIAKWVGSVVESGKCECDVERRISRKMAARRLGPRLKRV